jgi:predicted transcriptional regulator
MQANEKKMTFTKAAKLLGITRQSVHRTARKIQTKNPQEVIEYYKNKKAFEITWEIMDCPEI